MYADKQINRLFNIPPKICFVFFPNVVFSAYYGVVQGDVELRGDLVVCLFVTHSYFLLSANYELVMYKREGSMYDLPQL